MPISYYQLRGPLRKHKGNIGRNQIRDGDATFIVKGEQRPPPPFILAQEYICAELAGHIRLPLPPHFIARDHKGIALFCSMNLTISGASPPPLDRPDIACVEEPDLCTGLILFDIWMLNTDRHWKNVSFQSERPPQRLGIFDHSHTLFFYNDWSTRFRGRLAIGGHDAPGSNRHVLLDHLHTSDYLSKWITRIAEFPNEYLREVLGNAEELGLPNFVGRQAYDFLRERRDTLAQIVDDHRSEFTAIVDWGMLWGT
ncbi:MAG TPA: hypothetical protein VFJ16_03755 [Longimicrobium sp.]|nr:hypothetical protein [Longimicrobium sp.]